MRLVVWWGNKSSSREIKSIAHISVNLARWSVKWHPKLKFLEYFFYFIIFQQRSMKYVWQIFNAVYVCNPLHRGLPAAIPHSIRWTVRSLRHPSKAVRYYCVISFLLFEFAFFFFFKWKIYTKPSSCSILSKHYEAPKLSQNVCILIFHFLYVSISN